MTAVVSRRRARLRKVATDAVLAAAGLVLLVVIAYPFLWAVVTSFKTRLDALETTLIPFVQFQPSLENWRAELVTGWPETSRALRNSVLIATGAAAVATVLGTLAGYGLARFRFRVGNHQILAWFLSQRFLPPVATLIPFFVLFQQLRLIDTVAGMIIANATFVLPFAVLIMRDYFADFPRELEEAAVMDGAGFLAFFWRIALPLARPALAASAIICFAFAWNEFLFASVLTNRSAQPYTLLISSSAGVRGINFGFVATRMLLAVGLPVLLSLFVQRYIVRGLSMGAVKG